MPRINLNIPCYSPNWGSHTVVLLKIFEISQGPVLEMGIGVFSTPLLHALCKRDNRLLVSYDNDAAYINAHRGFITDGHQLTLVKDWDKIDIQSTKWGMAFMDHGPGDRRVEDTKKLANIAQFVVVHDTELRQEKYYHSTEIDSIFKYRFDYKELEPNTSVFSNFVDITNLKI